MVRRQFIEYLTLLGASSCIDFEYLASLKLKNYKIGACDWSLGQNSTLAAFDVAKSIGLDGVQVNLGTRQDGMHLRNKNTQIQFRDKAKETERDSIRLKSNCKETERDQRGSNP